MKYSLDSFKGHKRTVSIQSPKVGSFETFESPPLSIDYNMQLLETNDKMVSLKRRSSDSNTFNVTGSSYDSNPFFSQLKNMPQKTS